MTRKLSRNDISDDVVVIKINREYKPTLSEEQLYEVTRGIWKRKIESVSMAKYCLAVANSIVVEVYSIDKWYPAGTIPMKTRILNKERCIDRIEFVGEKAPNIIRDKYVGFSVADLYQWGEASPVKVFLKGNIGNGKKTINDAVKPLRIIDVDDSTTVFCPTCDNVFEKARRCPECGQLIDYNLNHTKKKKFKSLEDWGEGSEIIGANGNEVIDVVNKLLVKTDKLSYRLGTKDLSIFFRGEDGDKMCLLMLFGRERCGAIQPSTYFRYFEKHKITQGILDEFLEKMKGYLSEKQKNVPYERMNGYYFIEHKTIVEKADEFIDLLFGFCEGISY